MLLVAETVVTAVAALELRVELAVSAGKTFIVILSLQIHERLKRFEKRSPIPVQEHAARLASEVSHSLQTSFADGHAAEDDSSTAERAGMIFHGSNSFLWYTDDFPVAQKREWNVRSFLRVLNYEMFDIIASKAVFDSRDLFASARQELGHRGQCRAKGC